MSVTSFPPRLCQDRHALAVVRTINQKHPVALREVSATYGEL